MPIYNVDTLVEKIEELEAQIAAIKETNQKQYDEGYKHGLAAAAIPAEPVAQWHPGVMRALSEKPIQTSDTLLREALEEYQRAADHVGGCGDGGCVVKRPVGQHTNGGCRCSTDRMKAQRMMMAGNRLSRAIDAALADTGGA